ncbi:MAG: hypothetical protein Q4C14_05500 [Bacillota bacterium]|nr:hypothetical protein [Bacillota bacterium]
MKKYDRILYEKTDGSFMNEYSEGAKDEIKRICGQIVYESNLNSKTSYFEFLRQQSRYIKKRWWVLQIIVLAAFWIIVSGPGFDIYIERTSGICASAFAMMIIPEIWKNRESGSTEIECTCIYTLRQIIGARIVLFAFVDLLILSLTGFVLIGTGGRAAEELMIQFLLPYVVTCCIFFTCFYSSRHSVISAYVCCALWCWGWTWIVLNDNIYGRIAFSVWIILLAVSFSYLAFCIFRGQRRANTLWEVNIA